jgi:nodulation protein E
VFGVTSACSSANHAIASAVDQIRLGRADVMVAGGTEAPLVWGVLKGWEALRVLAPDTCRPFSADRQGLSLGEGAGMAVLESYDHAVARGATILAEIAGGALTADAFHISAPEPSGSGAARAMTRALRDAQMDPSEISYVAAHGTSTQLNDATETKAIRAAFGEHADRLMVSSNKSMIGHTLGAAGAMSALAAVLAIRDGIVPPTINYETPDPACDLDYVPNVARTASVDAAMVNGFGFGGQNAVAVFRRYRG